MNNPINLPPMPNILGLTATRIEQIMQEYAVAAVLADREKRGEPVAEVPYHDICADHEGTVLAHDYLPQGTKLYLAPQHVVDEQIKAASASLRRWVHQSSYEMLDRFLRYNLNDDDYTEYSVALDELSFSPIEQRKPLKVDQLRNLKWHLSAVREYEPYTGEETLKVAGWEEYARAIEALHDIKEAT